jgi:hypothetical protein
MTRGWLLVTFLALCICNVYSQFVCISGVSNCLNIREGPSNRARVISCVLEGTRMEDLSTLIMDNGITWRNIRYNGQIGWAASFYLVPCATAGNQANWTVLGIPLTSDQLRWLNYTAVNVVPRLKIYYNNAEEALNNTAYVAWWSLKEGIFDTTNPLRHSICEPNSIVISDDWAATCPSPRFGAWRVGLAGVQTPRSDEVAARRTDGLGDNAVKMYPELTGRVLSAFATEAGLAGAASSIQGSKGMVRASWLLRVPGVGFVEQAPFVTQFCVNSFTVHSSCYSRAWYPSLAYAPVAEFVRTAIADVRTILKVLVDAAKTV